jgi:hypothetical protein
VAPAVADVRLRPGTRCRELPHYYVSLLIRYVSLLIRYVSLLIRHGESVKTVKARLVPACASETLDTYAHLWPDPEDRTREAVDSAMVPAVWGGFPGIKDLLRGLMTVNRPVGGELARTKS